MISLVLDGSPEGCRLSADELARLAATLEDTDHVLDHARSVAAEAWRGQAGEAFGRRSAEVAGSAAEVAALVRMLVVALRWFATRLDRVRGQLEEARAAMVGCGVPVPPAALPASADPSWTPDQVSAHQRALRLVGAARQEERSAQAAWAGALARVADLHARRLQRSSPATAPPEPGVLDRIGDAVRVRSWPDLVPDLPDLPDRDELPDLLPDSWPDDWSGLVAPVVPVIRSGVDAVRRHGPEVLRRIESTPHRPQGPAKLFYTEALEQYHDDRGREDLPILERIGRSVLVGTGSAAGGTGALLLCGRLGLTGRAGTLCETGGAWLGEKGAEQLVKAVDAR